MKLYTISLGCPKNLVDSEKIIGRLAVQGVEIVSSIEDSDVIIINTCGFIKPAIDETIEEIEKASHFVNNGKKRLYVYGCAVNRLNHRLQRQFPKVSAWFRLQDQEKLLKAICPKSARTDSRMVTTKGYAYLKIADGCSNHCSYCTIPSIKGEYHSFDFDELVKEAQELAKLGARELILIGQDTTRYGIDKYKKSMLVPLLRQLSKISEIKWLRIMYAHPKTISQEIIAEIASNKKICKYLDMPIQHICDRILKLMNRGVTTERTKVIIRQINEIKGISLRTTLIAGFPTETDDEFKELFDYVASAGFHWLGLFPYSQEPGTKSHELTPLSDSVVKQRYSKLVNLQRKLIKKHNLNQLGCVHKTLIHAQNHVYTGHTEFQAPEIDGQTITKAKALRIGNFYNLKITKTKEADLYGSTDE